MLFIVILCGLPRKADAQSSNYINRQLYTWESRTIRLDLACKHTTLFSYSIISIRNYKLLHLHFAKKEWFLNCLLAVMSEEHFELRWLAVTNRLWCSVSSLSTFYELKFVRAEEVSFLINKTFICQDISFFLSFLLLFCKTLVGAKWDYKIIWQFKLKYKIVGILEN